MLELGCGTGTTAITLAPGVARYRATDISPGMIDIAKAKGAEADRNNLSFAVANAADVDADGPFAAVLAYSLLHLMGDVPATLAAIRDQLKPGGRLICKTVCLDEANVAIRWFVKALRLIGVAPQVTFLSQTQLEGMIEAAGFRIETRRHFSAKGINPFITARRAD